MPTKSCAIPALLLISAVANAAASTSDAASTVRRLYHDYAWEAVMSHGNDQTDLMQESRAMLERYFDHALADLIVKDRECSARTHEICNLDFLPIWSGQDPGATDLSVTSTNDPSVVLVQFHHVPTSESVKLTYTLSKSPAGWRISDIKGQAPGGKWDLLEILRRP
jgi:hypothetical protein